MTDRSLVDQGSPEWRDMLDRALEVIASMEGDPSLSIETRRRVYQDIAGQRHEAQQLRLALNLADVSLLLAHYGIRKWLLTLNELEEVPDADNIDIAWGLRVIEEAIEQTILEQWSDDDA